MHIYNACALGAAGRIVRPAQHLIPSQAATTLAITGGHGSAEVRDFHIPGIVSFKRAYAEVSGSFDANNGVHTTLAVSVVENLNVLDVVTADKVVGRLSAHHPVQGTKGSTEPSIVPVGSYFENLKIAGHPIRVNLGNQVFCDLDTFSKFEKDVKASRARHPWLVSGRLEKAKGIHPSLDNMRQGLDQLPETHGIYWASPASHLTLTSTEQEPCELRNFGSVIVVPKFGVVHIAELLIMKHSRQLNMLRIHMGSPVEGDLTVCSDHTNGTTYPPTGPPTGS